MLGLTEMNKVVEREHFRRPQQLGIEPGDKVCPDLRKSAWHGVHCRRQGRPETALQNRGLIRRHVAHIGQHDQKHISIASYPVMGNNTVETVRYTEPRQSTDKGLVWINKTQYFKGVPPEVWNLCLGGCQICQKWLKDCEGRALTHKDIRQYQRIVMALKEMLDLMAGIEAVLHHRQFNEDNLSIAAHN